MKLLYVLPEYLPQSGGGLITFYRWLLPELVRLGHRVTVLVGSGVTTGVFQGSFEGVEVRFLPHDQFLSVRSGFAAFEALPEMRRHLAAARALWELATAGEGFDLVETTDWGLLALPWLAEPGGPPVVVQLHGSMGQIDLHDPHRGTALQGVFTRVVEATAFAEADELQTYSAQNADYWESVTNRAVRQIRPALAPTSRPARERAGALVVGRIQKWKGVDTLCAALRLLGADAPPVDWAGRDTTDSGGASYARSLALQYGDIWNDKLIPVGSLEPDEVATRQGRASFAIVPSAWDVFNFTVVEAMAAGTPVVVSSGAGAAELVDDGHNGFVFPAGDANALAEAIRRLLALDPARREALGAAGRETVERELRPERISQLRVERYAEIVRQPRRRPTPWLQELTRPGTTDVESLSFLWHQPMTEIARHLGRRIREKADFR